MLCYVVLCYVLYVCGCVCVCVLKLRMVERYISPKPSTPWSLAFGAMMLRFRARVPEFGIVALALGMRV